MAAAIWLTPAGNLGIIPELQYYELPLDAYYTGGGTLQFRLIAGNLPPGLELYDDGRILGIPVLGQVRGVPFAIQQVTTSEFTIRIISPDNKVADRTFELTIAGILPPIIQPETTQLATYIDGNYVDIQLTAIEANPLLTGVFSILSGQLPPGLVLTPAGRIYGYIRPVTDPSSSFAPGFDGFISGAGVTPDKISAFDIYGFDAPNSTTSRNFQFTVQVDDSVNTDVQTYNIFVYARSILTADNDVITADLNQIITADVDTKYSPIILNESGAINPVQQNARYAYKIEGVDFDNDEITYQITSGSLPTGLTLNTSTGWITGIVPFGSLGSVTYNFSVRIFKTSTPIYISETKAFTIKLLGQIDDTVDWVTAANLGTIYNGSISQLYLQATTPSNRALIYNLITEQSLPIGLELQNDGTITGRVSFELYSLDANTTIFDSDLTSFDQTYTFTVSVSDTGNFVYSEKTFTIKIIKRDNQPYENLYIQALPNRSQREIYDDIINNTDILPNNYIYRPQDPWFGKNTLRRVLFLAGLNPAQAADYVNAIDLNHYWKTLNFGAVKTARAVDNNFETVYEVVYIELLDSGVNDQGVGPNLAVSLPTNSANVSTIYPNSFTNMATRVSDNIGYENRSILPTWMTSRQNDGTVLGFTRALVLAYTNPGKSAEVAYRINQEINRFRLIDFTIDRYEWDQSLSANFIKLPAQGTGNITANIQSNIVTGTSTLFTEQLLVTKPIYVSNISIGNIYTITSNTALTLTANSISNVSAQPFSYGTNVFIYNNFIAASGRINANSNSNIITGITTFINGAGTISGNVSNNLITGNGTTFAAQLNVGKQIYVGGNLLGTITSIQSNTSLRIDPVLGSSITNVAYTADGTNTAFTREIYVNDTIVVANAILGTVKTVVSNTNLILYSNSISTVSNVNYSHTARDPISGPGDGDQYLKFPQVNVLA